MKKWLFLLILSCGCAKKEDPNALKVGASPVPHAQILEFVKPEMKKKGINLILRRRFMDFGILFFRRRLRLGFFFGGLFGFYF